MNKYEIDYYNWLKYLIRPLKKGPAYDKLFDLLYSIEFTYDLRMDKNRAMDGLDLRRRYAYDTGNQVDSSYFCSVLEMLAALSIRIEESIMQTEEHGNRVGFWFWKMMENLNLKKMDDLNFDIEVSTRIVQTFLNREYSPDGKGGLFHLTGYKGDLRKTEIWYQMCWYLSKFS